MTRASSPPPDHPTPSCADGHMPRPEHAFPKRPALDDRNERLARCLWRAFPEARSENHLSELAEQALLRESGQRMTARGIRKWLSGDTMPQARNIAALAVLIGAEAVMDAIFGKDTR